MTNSSREQEVVSRAAATARRLSQRATEEILRSVLTRIGAAPERLAEILVEPTEPLVAFTVDRVVIAANAAADSLFGYSARELDGSLTDTIVPPRFRQPDAPPMAVTPDMMTVELPALRRDGSELPLLWTFGSVVTPARPIFVTILRTRDAIDDALEALHVSEERFRLLVEGVHDHAIFMLDAAGNVATWNSGAQRIKGWTADEIVGQPYEVFFGPEDRAAGVPAKMLQRAAEEGGVEVHGARARKDGSRFHAEGFLRPLFSRDGDLRGFTKIVRDLTERLAAEETARRLVAERAAREAAEAAEVRTRVGEERLRRLHRLAIGLSKAVTPEEVAHAVMEECLTDIDAAGGALYMLSEDGRALDLIGQRGHPDESLNSFRLLPLDLESPLSDSARTRTPLFFESFEACAARYPALRDAVRAGEFEASAALPLATHAGVVGALGIRYRHRGHFDDSETSLLLTVAELCTQALERARLFAAERHARAEAETANRVKDEFLAMLGHELRNPLAPISTAVELMKLKSDERTRRECDVIERQLRQLTTLVDDLLDVSRIARGRIEIARQPVEIHDVAAKAVEMARPLLDDRDHQFTIDVAAGLGVVGDTQRLAQVLANLLTNAAKYTPPRGHIALTACLEGSEVVVRVRDDGEGIAPDLLPCVFDLFVQGKRTIERSEGGLGLGLALVKNLVGLHGGSVEAHSEGQGRGSEFVVRLPTHTLPPAPPQPRAMPSRATPSRGTSRGKRVLVVDDNLDAAEMLTFALSRLGYDVSFALDGTTALARLRDFHAEVALLDLGLPVIDGFELARRIRQEFAGRSPRLIALTGYGRESDLAQTRAAGFATHLVKPIDLTAVVAAVESG